MVHPRLRRYNAAAPAERYLAPPVRIIRVIPPMMTDPRQPQARPATPVQSTRRFFTPAGLLLLAAFCAMFLLYGFWATNGNVNGWGDLAFIAVVAVIGLLALCTGVRGALGRGRAG